MSSRVLMATCLLITPSTARYTTPMPPFASTSFSSYLPFSLAEAGIGCQIIKRNSAVEGEAERLALLFHGGRLHAEVISLSIVSLGRFRCTNQEKHILTLD